MRAVLTASAVLAVLASGVVSTSAAAQAARRAPAPAASASAPLTAQGWGPLRIGMSRAQVVAAVGDHAPIPDLVDSPNGCELFQPVRAPQGLRVMIEGGVLTSVWLRAPARIQTSGRVGLRATPAAIRSAHGAAARFEEGRYAPAPAGTYTVWTSGRANEHGNMEDSSARGIAYHVGESGRVEEIAAGGPSIGYSEGCS